MTRMERPGEMPALCVQAEYPVPGGIFRMHRMSAWRQAVEHQGKLKVHSPTPTWGERQRPPVDTLRRSLDPDGLQGREHRFGNGLHHHSRREPQAGCWSSSS